MVKIYCDRCKSEIDKNYYTIGIHEYDVNPKYEPMYDTACSAYSSSETKVGALKMLNSQKMYCKRCKNEFEKFIYGA